MITMHDDHIANISRPIFPSVPLYVPSASGFGWVQTANMENPGGVPTNHSGL